MEFEFSLYILLLTAGAVAAIALALKYIQRPLSTRFGSIASLSSCDSYLTSPS